MDLYRLLFVLLAGFSAFVLLFAAIWVIPLLCISLYYYGQMLFMGFVRSIKMRDMRKHAEVEYIRRLGVAGGRLRMKRQRAISCHYHTHFQKLIVRRVVATVLMTTGIWLLVLARSAEQGLIFAVFALILGISTCVMCFYDFGK